MVQSVLTSVLDEPERLAGVAAAAGVEIDAAAPPTVEPFPCVLTNMTTEDLARVRFGAGRGSVVVKVARSPRHSPMWSLIPVQFQQQVMLEIPWRAEADTYRSRLRTLLPPGIRMPTLYAVDDLPDDRVAMWMEDVEDSAPDWTHDDYARAAKSLGRMAGRLPEAAIPADLAIPQRDFRAYFYGRVSEGTLPALFDDTTWSHPAVAGVADTGLRADLQELASRAPALLERLDRLPRTLAHGDACPQNLLRPAGEPEIIVAIDWTFVGIGAVGMDAGQLLAGRAESGDLEPAALPSLLGVIVDAYTAGLAAEGADIDAGDVRFGVAANLVVRSAFTALPLEALDEPVTAAKEELFRRRLGYARFLADLGRNLGADGDLARLQDVGDHA